MSTDPRIDAYIARQPEFAKIHDGQCATVVTTAPVDCVRCDIPRRRKHVRRTHDSRGALEESCIGAYHGAR